MITPDSAQCFHCGEPVLAGSSLTAEINGQAEPMCCPGCQMVAEQILALGLADYYIHRTGLPDKPEEFIPAELNDLVVFNEPALQETFLSRQSDTDKEVHLVIEGIVCPACAWLISAGLMKLEGVRKANVNYSTQRCTVNWDDKTISLADLLLEIHRLGYRAVPFNPTTRARSHEHERKSQLLRIGIAGLFGMQVMMIAIALYFGDSGGIDPRYRSFFYQVSLILTLPVLLYSAYPLFYGAWRDIRVGRPGMDIPITLGISIAFASSVASIIEQSGHVYFDSIVMFVFFILCGRYFEFISRKTAASRLDKLGSVLPPYARRLNDDGDTESVMLNALRLTDRVLVRPGEVIPVDGHVYQGTSTVNEAILTGESMPVKKSVGMTVTGGSTNIDSPLYIEITRIGEQTFLSHITRLVEAAADQKTGRLRLAEKIVSVFILCILTIAGLTATYWFGQSPERWLEITIAVLVVSCPCALSLAMPTALTSATATLMKYGIAVLTPDAVEICSKADTFVFDKTGTLTEGWLQLEQVELLHESYAEDDVLAIAVTLEAASEHPIARAITGYRATGSTTIARDLQNYPGQGITGQLDGEDWYIGTTQFIRQHSDAAPTTPHHSPLRYVLLANAKDIVACFYFSDHLRGESPGLIQHLQQAGHNVILMSGDQQPTVERIAKELGITQALAELSPEDKLQRIAELQQQGYITCMIGDGVNDAPAFAQSDIAIAMNDAADITTLNADLLLLNPQIANLAPLLKIVRKTQHTIRMNVGWAVGYNILALPVAVSGLLAPWMAALGMSLSSLVVVLNATRITKTDY